MAKKRGTHRPDTGQAKLDAADLRSLLSLLEGSSAFFKAQLNGRPPRGKRGRRNFSAREQAEELLDQAVADPEHAEALLRKAIKIDPDFSEAWLMLADLSEADQEVLRCYDEAIAAERRAIGEQKFGEYTGRFWMVMETRQYMEAVCQKAYCLMGLRRLKEAAAVFREMLRLNPNDNQGVRELLATCYLDLRQHHELQELFASYPDDGRVTMVYCRALLAFRLHGDCEQANRLLGEARQANRHVPEFLLGEKTPPQYLPEMVIRGGEDEAATCAVKLLLAWKETSGAISWLRQQTPMSARPPTNTQLPVRRSVLMRLPQSDACWLVDMRRMPRDTESNGEEPDWALVVAERDGRPLALKLLGRSPSIDEVWQQLEALMLYPDPGEPSRPRQVLIGSSQPLKKIAAKLRRIDIEALEGELASLNRAFESLRKRSRQAALAQSQPTIEQLLELPQSDETWQADVRRAPMWVTTEQGPQRPWIAFAMEPRSTRILRTDLNSVAQPPPRLADLLILAMAIPAVGPARRPATVEVVVADDATRALLAALKIRLVVRDNLTQLENALDDLALSMNKSESELPALCDVPGANPEEIGEFFAAAASYFRSTPWRLCPPDDIVRIECREPGQKTWHGVVMGQSGMTLGLALYDSWQELRQLLADNPDRMRSEDGYSMMYCEAFEINIRDVVACERLGWEVASPEAWPLALRLSRGRPTRLQHRDLNLLTACLHAFPAWLQNKSSEWQSYPGIAGTVMLRLTGVTDDIR